MKKIYIIGCFVIGLMIAFGVYDRMPRDLSNQMVYVSRTSEDLRKSKLYYLRDMNHPERKKYVATCLEYDTFFSENGKYLYYVSSVSASDNHVDTMEYCRVAVKDLWKPQMLRGTKKYTVKQNQIEKVRGEDAILYLSKHHELILCENGKEKELAKSIKMFDVIQNGDGVIANTEGDSHFFISLDNCEKKLIMENAYMESCEDGENGATYCEFDDFETDRIVIYRIAKDGEVKEIHSIEDALEEEIYITGPSPYGENAAYYLIEEMEWIPYKDLVKEDYVVSENEEDSSLSDDEKKEQLLLQKVRKYLKMRDVGSEENYVYSLYLVSDGKEGSLVSDGIIQDFSSPNLIAYKKLDGERNQISMTSIVKRLAKEIPKVNEKSTYQEKIQMILWEKEAKLVNPMKCYVLLDGKEVQLDVEGDVLDVKRFGETQLLIQAETYDRKDEKIGRKESLYVADIAGDKIAGMHKIEDIDSENASFLVQGTKCYYYNQNHNLCMLQDGTTDIVIENVSTLDQVGVLADGTLFYWSDNVMTYYGEDEVKQIEGGKLDTCFADLNSYFSIRKDKVYLCADGKKEQKIMEGYKDLSDLCVYKWQNNNYGILLDRRSLSERNDWRD